MSKDFGTTKKGEKASLYTIAAGNCSADISDYGATLVSFVYTDKAGKATDILLGFDSAAGYEENGGCLGATVGRNANRIGKGHFVLNGKDIQMPINENDNSLHSGPDVFYRRMWKTDGVSADGTAITLSLDSPDGDQGLPGNFTLQVTYQMTADASLHIRYEACCDQDTICNPTNHSYFNLDGHDSGKILDQKLQIFADRFTVVADGSIPTGELRPVAGTIFDFTEGRVIGQNIDDDEEQFIYTAGYDHNWVVSDEKGEMKKMAVVYGAKSGLALACCSDLPGVQFYAGNFIPEMEGKGGVKYSPRTGLCLETQFFPDAVNQEGFAKPYLKAGEKFESETVYHIFEQ